jgi:hypothetical protein
MQQLGVPCTFKRTQVEHAGGFGRWGIASQRGLLKSGYSNRNPARLAACSFGSVEAMFPKIMSPPDQLYVPLTPHSSTRFGAAKLDPLPGKRRTSLRRLRKNECSQVPQG